MKVSNFSVHIAESLVENFSMGWEFTVFCNGDKNAILGGRAHLCISVLTLGS